MGRLVFGLLPCNLLLELGEPFGILFNLILERTQIFGSAATLATLEVGKAMLPHMLKQFILQDAV